MTAAPSALVKPMAGRDVLALAIADLEHRAEYGRSVADAYGEAAIDRELRVGIELDAALAIILRTLQMRGAVRLEDRPKGKDGAPLFVSKIRHETTAEIVQFIVGALRSAYAKAPPAPKETSRDAA